MARRGEPEPHRARPRRFARDDVQFAPVTRSEPPIRAGDGRSDQWHLNELVRRRRLRERARRPLAENLAEGLALCEFLATFRGAARR